MKKFLYFTATVLSLSVIFGAGWASGVGRMNKAQPTNVEVPEQSVEETVPDGDVLPDDPDGHTCPKEDKNCESRDGEKIIFRFRMPCPDFPALTGRFPRAN